MAEQLLDASEVARVLGTSRQQAARLAESADFPRPQTRKGQRSLWPRRAIEVWAAAHPERGPGWRRPPIGRPGLWTERNLGVMNRAGAQAKELDHGWIGDEHLLRGLLAPDGRSPAQTALESCGLTLEAARRATAELVGEPWKTAYGSLSLSYLT